MSSDTPTVSDIKEAQTLMDNQECKSSVVTFDGERIYCKDDDREMMREVKDDYKNKGIEA